MITPTLFSVSYAGLWGQHRLDTQAFIRKAAKLGYPAVELMGKRPHLSVLNDVDHPNCRAMFDPWSPALHGADLESAARRLAPRMVQTTLADYVRLARYAYQPGLINYKPLGDMIRAVPLGDGFIDLEGFFRGLGDGGFEGYAAYEICSPLRGGGGEDNLDRAATHALDMIRRLTG